MHKLLNKALLITHKEVVNMQTYYWVKENDRAKANISFQAMAL